MTNAQQSLTEALAKAEHFLRHPEEPADDLVYPYGTEPTRVQIRGGAAHGLLFQLTEAVRAALPDLSDKPA